MPDLIQTLIDIWDNIEFLHERFVYYYPPDIYQVETLEPRNVFRLYTNIIQSVIDPAVTSQVNAAIDASFTPHEHHLLYAFINSWIDNLPRNGYTDPEGDYLIDGYEWRTRS